MSQAFYRKWRPQKWDEVVAQEHVIQTLRNAVRTGRTGHAYLLAGPRGTGKTTTARLLAKAMNCLDEDPANRPCDTCAHCQAINTGRFLDLIEIDAASNTSVDDVRDLREKINFSPTQGRYKVYIIDEVHMLSTAAFNALLKTLEEPPPHAIFILATTEVHKIPATILSRVQRYEFRRIPVNEIVRHLRAKAAEEQIEVEEEALTLIARQATGAMRDAISLLDQLASTGNRVTLAEAQVVLGTATSGMVIELVEAVLARDPARGLKTIQTALDAGTDARQFARQVVDYLRNLLLVKMGNADQVDATQELRQQMHEHARGFEPARLLEAIRLFNTAATDARSSWHPGLALELALAEMVEEKEAPGPTRDAAASHAAVSYAPAPQPPATREGEAEEVSRVPKPGARASENPPVAGTRQPAAEPARSQAAQNAARVSKPDSSVGRVSKPDARASEDSPAAEPDLTQSVSQPSGGNTVTLADIQKNWSRIRSMVNSKNKLTAAALNSGRPTQLKDNVLVLGFATEVVKSKMESTENIEILRQALQAIFNTSLGIRCVVVGSKASQPADLDVDGDGIVGTALDLGGKIVYKE